MFDIFRQYTTAGNSGTSADPETDQQNLSSKVGEAADNLGYETRIYCFIGCFILSLFCSILGSPLLIVGKLTGFAVMVSLGSIISIGGTFFLSGPRTQLRKMFERSRIFATLLYLTMIVLTLVAGLAFHSPVLAVACIIGQYLAMAWYSISFIPYARQVISGCFSKLCGFDV